MREVALLALVFMGGFVPPSSPEGPWRAALDVAGGELRFGLTLERREGRLAGELCNGDKCQPFSSVALRGDSVVLEMADYAATAPDYWGLSEESKLTNPVGGKLTMSFSKGPLVGANWLTIGDAAGAINPWNGEGISYAYETGRIAAEYVGQALGTGDSGLIRRYPQHLEDEYGLYYKTARIFVKLIGYPTVMRTLAHTGLRNTSLMEWTLKVMANLLDEDDKHMGERVYDALAGVVRTLPTK